MARDEVAVTDLEVIARYSLAVRAPSADRGELIATLRSDLAWLEGAGSAGPEASEEYEDYTAYNEPPTAPRPAATAPRGAVGGGTGGSRRGAVSREPGAVRRDPGAVRREPGRGAPAGAGRGAPPGADRSPAPGGRARGRSGR